MADIFRKSDAQRVVEYRIIWLLGDSNVRAIYKDLVWLLHKNTLIDFSSLRNKLEDSYMNDNLIKGNEIHKGRNYTEIRCFEDFAIPTKIEFTFITECLSNELRNKITHLSPFDTPDVIVMNSCLWDITRWGPDGVNRYKQNVRALLQLFKNNLPSKTLVVWTTTPPLSTEPIGGFLIKQINFMKPFLRFEVMEANVFLREEVVRYGFDLLDIHYHLMLQIHRRRPDGIHWNPDAVRHMTNLLLTHIALSLDLPLPGNFSSPFLEKMVCVQNESDDNNNNNNDDDDDDAIKGENSVGNVKSKVVFHAPTLPSSMQHMFGVSSTSSNTIKNGKSKKRKKTRESHRRQNSGNIFCDQNAAPHMYGHNPKRNSVIVKMKNCSFNRQQRNNYYRPY